MSKKGVISQFRNQLRTLIVSAFGFAAALAWRDVIEATIQLLVPQGNELPLLLLNAVVITFIGVLAARLLSKKKYDL